MPVWKPVLGYEGYYEVSDDGQIYSVPRIDTNGVPRGGHLMKIGINCRSHYPVVHLRKNGKSKLCKIHILILEAFVGPRPVGMLGLHSDDIKTNCNLSNLRWGTQVENCADRHKNGHSLIGEKNPGGGKLTEIQVRQIKSQIGSKYDYLLAADFGISTATIQDIKHGRSWAHVS